MEVVMLMIIILIPNGGWEAKKVAGPHAGGTMNATIAQILRFGDVDINFTHPHFVQSKTIPSFGGQEFKTTGRE